MPQASRLTRTLLWISSIAACVTIVVVALIFTQVRGFAQASSADRESDEVAACRAELRGDIDLSTARVDEVILRGLSAVATGSDDQLGQILETAPAVLEDLNEAVDRYRDGTALSLVAPEQFVEQCKARRP